MTTPAAPSATSLTLKDKKGDKIRNYPDLFYAADTGAIRSQNLHFAFARAELICVSLAAAAELFGRLFARNVANILSINFGAIHIAWLNFSGREVSDWFAGNILAAFFMALAILSFVVRSRLHFAEFWHKRRSLAEATKGLAWRYGMRAMSADLQAEAPLDDATSRKVFLAELDTQKKQAASLRLPVPDTDARDISDNMALLRAAAIAVQRKAYIPDRLEDQRGWYTRKAEQFSGRTKGLQVARGIVYFGGLGLILVNGIGPSGFAVMTTIAGGIATWLVGKRYDELSQSYTGMVRKLMGFTDAVPTASSPNQSGSADARSDWATFVDQVESLLDGEHQDWLREIADIHTEDRDKTQEKV
jgi:hypothetical protein